MPVTTITNGSSIILKKRRKNEEGIMRKITAHYIYPVTSPPLKNGIIELDDSGYIQNIIDTNGRLSESSGLEFYNGIIVPGFVNAHCHIELSHLRNKIEQQTGLPGFIPKLTEVRKNATPAEIATAIGKADKLMFVNGTVAVGDISNTKDSFAVKAGSRIKYHTFIEVFGLDTSKASVIFKNAIQLFDLLIDNYKLPASITPHAPYSMSNELFKLIREFSEKHDFPLSFHNQESKAENDFFENMSGQLFEVFLQSGIDLSGFKPTGKHSLPSVLEHFAKKRNTLLVHNTFSNANDIESATNYFRDKYLFLVFCPKSNLYIENHLPDIINIFRLSENICIGTDSFASNTTLSVLEEMKLITKHFPEIQFNEILKWGTLNGAKALHFDSEFGSIEIGKHPGLNLIQNFDFTHRKLTGKSNIQVI